MCGMVAMDAVYPYARDRLHFPEHITVEGLETHKVGDVLFWGSEEPDTFIDISDTIDLKIGLAEETRIAGVFRWRQGRGEFVRANARRVGQRADIPYAEAFRRGSIRR